MCLQICDHRLFPLTSSHKLRSVRFWGTFHPKGKTKKIWIRDAIPLPKGRNAVSSIQFQTQGSAVCSVQCAVCCSLLVSGVKYVSCSQVLRLRRVTGMHARLIRSAVPIDAATRRVDRPLPCPTQGARVWIQRLRINYQDVYISTILISLYVCIHTCNVHLWILTSCIC